MGTNAKSKPAATPLGRRWQLNLALILVVIGLGVFVWWRATGERPDPRPALTAVDAASVDSIEITRPNQAPIVLHKDGAAWQLLSPVKARVNHFAVETALRVLKAPSEGQIAVDGNLAQYGLKRPALTVRYDGTAIEFGVLHPLKDLHYVRVGTAVHLIGARHYADLARPYGVYLDMALFEENRKPVAFRLPDFTLTLKDGEWRRQPPLPTLSSDTINAFVDSWRRARAVNAERYAQQPVKERFSVSFEDETGKRSTLVLGVLQREPAFMLLRQDEGLVYQFPASVGRRLLSLEPEPAPTSAK